MTAAHVKKEILWEFKHKKFLFWTFIRIISSFGPIIATYIFAKGVQVIEDGQPITVAVKVFLILLVVELVEHLLRLASKTRMSLYTEEILVNIQEALNEYIHPDSDKREETIQTFRNLTQSLRRLVTHLYMTGIPALLSFIAIPIIIYFLDLRVFLILISMIIVYFFVTLMFSKEFKRDYEDFDESREDYFSSLLENTGIKRDASKLISKFKDVENTRFISWLSEQFIMSFFAFIIIILLVQDIYSGTKQLSDLVLIFGYIAASKIFLINTTLTIHHYMEIEAAVSRIEKISSKDVLEINVEKTKQRAKKSKN